MDISANEIESIEDAGTLNGGNVKLLRTKGGFWIAIGRQKGSPREEALTAGSHPAIVKYNLERQFPDFQPILMKSEMLSDNVKVEKHSHFLSDDLRKSGHDLFSVQNGTQIEFQITKHNAKVSSVMGRLENDAIVIQDLKSMDKQFSRAMAGATSEKALSCGSKKIRIQR